MNFMSPVVQKQLKLFFHIIVKENLNEKNSLLLFEIKNLFWNKIER